MKALTRNKDVSGTKPEDSASVIEATPAEQGHSQAHEASGKRPLWSRTMNRVQGSVWPREFEGKISYSASISRSYYDRKSNEWKRVSSYDRKDLQDLISVATEADAEMLRLEGMTQVAGED